MPSASERAFRQRGHRSHEHPREESTHDDYTARDAPRAVPFQPASLPASARADDPMMAAQPSSAALAGRTPPAGPSFAYGADSTSPGPVLRTVTPGTVAEADRPARTRRALDNYGIRTWLYERTQRDAHGMRSEEAYRYYWAHRSGLLKPVASPVVWGRILTAEGYPSSSRRSDTGKRWRRLVIITAH